MSAASVSDSGGGEVPAPAAAGGNGPSPPGAGPDVRVTPAMAQAAKRALALQGAALPAATREHIGALSWALGGRVPFAAVKLLVATLRGTGSAVHIHELLEGTEIVVDPLKAPEPNPELVERRKKLQAMMDEADYQKRVRRFEGRKGMADKYVGPLEVQEGRKILGLVVQLLVTMASCFAAGWYAVGHLIVDDKAMMALGGIVCMVAAVGAELYFLMKTSILKPKVA